MRLYIFLSSHVLVHCIDVSYQKPFSYVDTACAFVYFNLFPRILNERVRNQIKDALSIRESHRDNFANVMFQICSKLLFTEFRNLFFHEWHHSLQAVFYPYQYLQSWRELNIAFHFFSFLRHSSQQIKLGHQYFHLSDKMHNTLTYPSMVHGIDITEDKKLILVDRELSDLQVTDITLTDLIEDATSIFQYKVEKGEEGNGKDYRRWIKEQKLKDINVYSNVFQLLSKVIGDESAYIALPPLVQASFHTTWPATYFVNMVNFTIEQDLPVENLGCDTYYTILNPIRRLKEFPEVIPNPKSASEEDQFSPLTNETYKVIIENTQKHTVYPLAKRYLEIVSNSPNIEKFLFHPYRIEVQNLLRDEFLPPLTVLRLGDNQLRARDTIMVLNPNLIDMKLSIDPATTYKDYLPEVQKRKDIAYSFVTDINNRLEHNCHHHACPLYPTNVCRRWTAIPKEMSNCPFPIWFTKSTGRFIDLNRGEINGQYIH